VEGGVVETSLSVFDFYFGRDSLLLLSLLALLAALCTSGFFSFLFFFSYFMCVFLIPNFVLVFLDLGRERVAMSGGAKAVLDCALFYADKKPQILKNCCATIRQLGLKCFCSFKFLFCFHHLAETRVVSARLGCIPLLLRCLSLFDTNSLKLSFAAVTALVPYAGFEIYLLLSYFCRFPFFCKNMFLLLEMIIRLKFLKEMAFSMY
jgi:hypothetical protein